MEHTDTPTYIHTNASFTYLLRCVCVSVFVSVYMCIKDIYPLKGEDLKNCGRLVE